MKYSKWERTHCPHGRIYWVRWAWEDDDTIENSTPDYSGNRCKKCLEDE